MQDILDSPGKYPIEVSGWGLDDAFFAEKTNMIWSEFAGKRVLLHRTLAEGTIIFVRLLASESLNSSLPIPYSVEVIQPMDCNGACEMRLVQLQPRLKAPIVRAIASDAVEDSYRSEPKENGLQLGEILR